MSRFALVALVVTSTACVSDDDHEPPDSIEARVPLAEVEGDGGAIRWFAPDAPGDDLTMQVEAHFPSPPLVDSTLVDELSAVRVYLAVAPVDRPLPVGLVPYATPAELTLSNDVVARSALRDRNLQRLAEFAPDLDVQEVNPASCDAAFRNWARATYGDAYGDTSTCTNDTGFGDHVGDTWYCNLNGQDCDYGLAETQACEADNCTAVVGELNARRARFAVWPNGDPSFTKSGIRARLGFANCDWNYTAVQRRQRNYGAWQYLDIPPRAVYYHVQGASDPRPGAYPTLGLLGGFWKQEIDSSSPNFLQNRQEIIAPTEGFVCSDVIQHFETFDGSPLSCNNGQRLCDDSSCSGWGNCWD